MSTERIGVFLDRDGTINVEVDFVRTPDQLQLIAGAAQAIRRLNDLGVVVCVISNQSGIARGYLTEDDLGRIHERLSRNLKQEDAHVDRIYYCPHHPTEGIAPYVLECECRKPKAGMLRWAERDLGVDLSKSFLVGDRLGDIQAGKAVGATTILVRTGYGEMALRDNRIHTIPPDFIAADISEAVEYILNTLKGRHNLEGQ
ncbi:MAG: D-glycero-beta-D-manno-heptose 1,7-bisphosphate 7-phosphatase [Bacteroidota bacterium]